MAEPERGFLMSLTPYADANDLLRLLIARQQVVFGAKLIGVYLYGSLAWGDFDRDSSDIDLLAALDSDITEAEAESIRQMHEAIAREYPVWNDRIEVQYYAREGLRHYRTQSRRMGNISPGEPFHVIEAGADWLSNWYAVRTYGLALLGAPPDTLIDPISAAEFQQVVRLYAEEWRERIHETRDWPGAQAYAVLTLCRALYTLRFGEQVSKPQAAQWAAAQWPEWAELLHHALLCRRNPSQPRFTFAQAVAFVGFMLEKIAAEPASAGG
jgi:predicted nucleotidyltransferase